MVGSTSSKVGQRVLVVDDYPDSAAASCMLLSALGHECCAAVSGEQALAEAEQFHPSVVLCDIGLPDISGYEVARALRTRYGHSLYLAALSGWARAEDRVRSLEAGFDQHIVKPANLKLLHAVMSASLRGTPAPA